MATEPKKITDLTTKNIVDLANDKVVVNHGTSSYQMPMQKVIDAATKATLVTNTDGVTIYTVDNRGILRLVRPSKWEQYKNSGYFPVGIVVSEGEKELVVALDECPSSGLKWGNSPINDINSSIIQDQQLARADWNGAGNTRQQVTHPECSSVNFAPGFCYAYSKLNANNKGLAAGKWYQPALGQLKMIYTNFEKINYALSLIDGATLLSESNYWSSTNGSDSSSWGIYFASGYIFDRNMTTGICLVRPVADL